MPSPSSPKDFSNNAVTFFASMTINNPIIESALSRSVWISIKCLETYNNSSKFYYMRNEMPQRTNYILVDYENVQPKSLELIANGPFKVCVFIGAQQARIPADFATEMQSFGSKAEYITIAGSGRNALDFHIAFYIGQISREDPNSYFHIISKDKGFDPLVTHLKSKGVLAKRSEEISKIPLFQESPELSKREKYDTVVKRLISMKKSRPRTLKSLVSTIQSTLQGKITCEEAERFVQSLRSKKYVEVQGSKVSYKLEG